VPAHKNLVELYSRMGLKDSERTQREELLEILHGR
jgi:hypothetical protein